MIMEVAGGIGTLYHNSDITTWPAAGDELQQAKEKYLVMHLLWRSCNCFHNIRSKLMQDKVTGADNYPKTVQEMFELMVHFGANTGNSPRFRNNQIQRN